MTTLKYTRLGINRPNFDFATSKPISVSMSKFIPPKHNPIFNLSDNLRISHEQAGIEPRNIGDIQQTISSYQSVEDALSQGILAKIVSIPELKPDGSIVRDVKGNAVYTQRVFKDILYNNDINVLKQYRKYIITETQATTDLAKQILLNEIKNKGYYGKEYEEDDEEDDEDEDEEDEEDETLYTWFKNLTIKEKTALIEGIPGVPSIPGVPTLVKIGKHPATPTIVSRTSKLFASASAVPDPDPTFEPAIKRPAVKPSLKIPSVKKPSVKIPSVKKPTEKKGTKKKVCKRKSKLFGLLTPLECEEE